MRLDNDDNNNNNPTVSMAHVIYGHFSKCFTYINSEIQETAVLRMTTCPGKRVDKRYQF